MEKQELTTVLQSLEAEHGGLPVLEFSLDDPLIEGFLACSNHGLPAVDRGQSADCRWSLPGGRSLHAHWHLEQRRVRFHLDVRDPRTDPLGHLALDTRLPLGAGLGGALGGLAGGGWGALLGAVIGGALGLQVPRGFIRRWRLTYYRSADDWEAVRVGREREPVVA